MSTLTILNPVTKRMVSRTSPIGKVLAYFESRGVNIRPSPKPAQIPKLDKVAVEWALRNLNDEYVDIRMMRKLGNGPRYQYIYYEPTNRGDANWQSVSVNPSVDFPDGTHLYDDGNIELYYSSFEALRDLFKLTKNDHQDLEVLTIMEKKEHERQKRLKLDADDDEAVFNDYFKDAGYNLALQHGFKDISKYFK